MTNPISADRFSALSSSPSPGSGNGPPPVLLSATPAGAAGSMSIALNFSTTMAAGSGAITITDGAVETVIDRVTGLPVMRVVGATDTHLLSASQVSIDGSQVTLEVAGLLPGHTYSVVMGAGVLASADHVAFGGVRSTSQLQFDVPPAPDTTAPTLVSAGTDGGMLKAGGSIVVTFTFSEAVQPFGAESLASPNASVTGLSTSDGGITWQATLQAPDGALTSAVNALTLDMSKVHDMAGNAGTGISQLASYAVDTAGPGVSAIALDGDTISGVHGIGLSVTFSEAVQALDAGAFISPGASVTGLHSTDGGLTWSGILDAPAGTTSAGNLLGIDLGKVADLAGNAGAGVVDAATAYTVDTQGPGATIELGGNELKYGEPIGLTIRLTDRVDALPDGALSAPNATIGDLHTIDAGLTWVATLSASGNAVSAANAVSLDLSTLLDASGNAGAVSHSANYTVDNAVAAFVGAAIGIDDGIGPSTSDYVSASADQHIHGTLSEALKDGQHLMLTVDGQAVPVAFDGLSWTSGDAADYVLHLDDGVHTIVAAVVDDAGHGSASVTRQFTIDTVHPLLVASPDGADVATDVPLSFTFNEALYPAGGGAVMDMRFVDAQGGSFDVDIDASNLSADGRTVTLAADQLHLLSGQDYTVYLPDNLTDLAGNSTQTVAPLHFHTTGPDVEPPSATSAVAQAATGIYGIGAQIEIDVAFSEAVKVDAADLPALHLSNGGLAVYDRTSDDQKTLVFKYTVGADADSASLGFADNSGLAGHVSDLAGNLLDTAHIGYAALGVADGFGGPIQIDAHAPAAPGAPVLDSVSDTGAAGDGLSAAQQPTLSGSGSESDAAIQLFDGDRALALTHSDASGHWTITAADWDGQLADGVHNLVVRQSDAAGNTSPVSGALTLTVDTTAPGAPGRPVLAASSDSGLSHSDGITNVAAPTITGTALEAGGTVELYEGDALLGTATVGADKTWSYTIGSQPGRLPAFADGVHALTVKEVDAAGNQSAASEALSITVDTVAPTVTATAAPIRSGLNWFVLNFSEKIVFDSGALDVLDTLGSAKSHLSWDVQTNWDIANDSHGVPSVLEMNLHALAGLFHLQVDSNALQDLAGNVAIIGIGSFSVGPTA